MKIFSAILVQVDHLRAIFPDYSKISPNNHWPTGFFTLTILSYHQVKSAPDGK
jgi:hypothetical protein